MGAGLWWWYVSAWGCVCRNKTTTHLCFSRSSQLRREEKVVKKKTSIVERRARLSSVVEIKTRCYRYSGEGEFPFRGWE